MHMNYEKLAQEVQPSTCLFGVVSVLPVHIGTGPSSAFVNAEESCCSHHVACSSLIIQPRRQRGSSWRASDGKLRGLSRMPGLSIMC